MIGARQLDEWRTNAWDDSTEGTGRPRFEMRDDDRL
jgi:hypothetical protein